MLKNNTDKDNAGNQDAPKEIHDNVEDIKQSRQEQIVYKVSTNQESKTQDESVSNFGSMNCGSLTVYKAEVVVIKEPTTNARSEFASQDLINENTGPTASNQQSPESNQQSTAIDQQYTASNPENTASNQQTPASNQQNTASNQQTTASNQQNALSNFFNLLSSKSKLLGMASIPLVANSTSSIIKFIFRTILITNNFKILFSTIPSLLMRYFYCLFLLQVV